MGGGGGSDQVVGYKYKAGMHMILCHGPIDRLVRARIAKKIAWLGSSGAGTISINKTELFGGESREGGIKGNMDIEFGGDTQPPNSYLTRNLGSDIPAFRGVVGIILRSYTDIKQAFFGGFYWGQNPYLKKWDFRAQRVFTRQNGIEQWYLGKAPIVIFGEPLALHIALDFSGSMNTITANGQSRFTNMKTAIYEVLDMLKEAVQLPETKQIDLRLAGFTRGGSILKREITPSGIEEVRSWLVSQFADGGTDFRAGVTGATDFYADGPPSGKKISIFLTDGEPSAVRYATEAGELLFQTSGVIAYAFNIDLTNTTYTAYLDNTPDEGVTVLTGDNLSELRNTIFKIVGTHIDMNPAHIIRECLTDPIWGMGYPENEIDAESFESSADTLFSEFMGISLLWDKQIPIMDFITEIIRHIDATLYVDRKTGKFVLKLIREDYDIETLITLNPSNSKKVTNFVRPTIGELVNSLTVNFWNYKTGETSSITVEDPALIQMQGSVINTTIQYPGFTHIGTGSRAALRDLKTLSTPLISGQIETGTIAKDFNIGQVFKLTWPDYEITESLVRIAKISFGDGKNNAIKISFVQDKFDFSPVQMVIENEDSWEEPGGSAVPVSNQITEEATYFGMVQFTGQDEADSTLTATPTAGFLAVSSDRPANGINARLWVDDGGGYEDVNPLEFSPSAIFLNKIYPTDESFFPDFIENLDSVVAGTYGQIGSELVRFDSIDEETGELILGRGVLDTYPQEHAAGSIAIFWGDWGVSNLEEYQTPDIVSAKITPATGEGTLDIADATASSVQFNNRAIRPFLPGNISINSVSLARFFPPVSTYITWVGRDRLQQTGPIMDFFDGNIGPEAGTTWDLKLYDEDDALIDSLLGTVLTERYYSQDAERIALNKTVLASGGIFDTVGQADSSSLEAYYPASGLNGSSLPDASGEGNDAIATNITASAGDAGLIFTGAIDSHIEFPNVVFNETYEYAISMWLTLEDQVTESALLSLANSVIEEDIYLGVAEQFFVKEKGTFILQNEGPTVLPLKAKTHIVIVREQV